MGQNLYTPLLQTNKRGEGESHAALQVKRR